MEFTYNSSLWRIETSIFKVESASSQLSPCLLSPPSSPPYTSSVKYPATVSRQTSNPKRSALSSSLSERRRTSTPYSRPTRSVESNMSNPYGSWSPSSVKSGHSQGHRHYGTPPHAGPSRRSGSGDQQTAFGFSDSFSTDGQYPSRSSRHTPPSSSNVTSSLSGAMGDINAPPRSSGTASPAAMAWVSPTPTMQEVFAVAPDDGTLNPTFLGSPPTPLTSGSASTFLSYHPYNTASYPSDNSNAPHPSGVPSSGFSDAFYARQPLIPNNPALSSAPPAGMAMSLSPAPHGATRPREALESEVLMLRKKVRELEMIISRNAVDNYGGSPSSNSVGGLPSPMPTPTFSASEDFKRSWKARTDARVKLYCSLNRAGNALCAWHDSRRERRAHPPRMAPRGILNCGCSYEEALFEESLARHGVGSYHPGESVRMDPALRNPLLKLLRERYGYRDGDFERDPVTGSWCEGEGPAIWEQKVASGATASRKHRAESSR